MEVFFERVRFDFRYGGCIGVNESVMYLGIIFYVELIVYVKVLRGDGLLY